MTFAFLVRRLSTSVMAVALVCSACSQSTQPSASSSPVSTTSSASGAATPSSNAAASADRLNPTASPATESPGAGSARSTGQTKTESQGGPPAAGTYTYEQSGRFTIGASTFEPSPEGTLEVARATEDGNWLRQRQVRRYSDDSTTETTLLFGRTAVLLEEQTVRFGFTEIRCRADEPLLVVKLPLRVGNSWSDETTCENGMRVRITGSVVRTERRQVGSDRVDTFIVRHRFTATSEDYSQNAERTSWLSPVHGLVVRSVEESEGRFRNLPFTNERMEHLTNLRPE